VGCQPSLVMACPVGTWALLFSIRAAQGELFREHAAMGKSRVHLG
jgi:hypothetical protein